jgi:dolichol-phosphate mannosyltransferase
MPIEGHSIAVVIPAYQAEKTIPKVIKQIPPYVDWIIIINDASTDSTLAAVKQISDPRICILCHKQNMGIGAAMVTGFKKAIELQVDLIAKIDADGQMDAKYLDRLARASLLYDCDYVKANRFGHLEAIPEMPKIRLWGSIFLSFMTKFVSGYWNVFDPQNGYVMITRRMLLRLDLKRIDQGYFFENSMLILLNIVRARIGEIYIPACYGEEKSSMKLFHIVLTFPGKLCSGFAYRIYQKYFFRSLSPFFILFFWGVLCCSWGFIWGGWAWYKSFMTDVPATTGTVVLALLPLILGWSSLLQALVLDVQDAGPCLLFDFDDDTLKTTKVDSKRDSSGSSNIVLELQKADTPLYERQSASGL